MRNPRNILITGASSGIGGALAEAYARPNASLALSGRDAARLEAVAERCRAKGAAVVAATVDVADPSAMAAWVLAIDRDTPLDLVHANAGIASGRPADEDPDTAVPSLDAAQRLVAVNLGGVLNTVLPVLPLMAARRSGQIAIMSSLAAYLPYPGVPLYGATKAAVKHLGESLRMDMRTAGVGVTVICPGYVRSRMTASLRRTPLIIDADAAADLIRRRLQRNPPVIAFPWQFGLASWFIGALPARARQQIFKRSPRPE